MLILLKEIDKFLLLHLKVSCILQNKNEDVRPLASSLPTVLCASIYIIK